MSAQHSNSLSVACSPAPTIPCNLSITFLELNTRHSLTNYSSKCICPSMVAMMSSCVLHNSFRRVQTTTTITYYLSACLSAFYLSLYAVQLVSPYVCQLCVALAGKMIIIDVNVDVDDWLAG